MARTSPGRRWNARWPIILQWDENFDVGSDPGTPVDDKDYRVPFKFTGKLNKLTLTIAASEVRTEPRNWSIRRRSKSSLRTLPFDSPLGPPRLPRSIKHNVLII